MTRSMKAIPLGLAVFVLLVATVPLQAAGPKPTTAQWENLQSVASGSTVRVVLNDAKSFTGRLRAVGDAGLTLRTDAGEQTFARESILRVSTKSESHRKRNALIGLAVGGATGAIVGVASPELGTGTCAQGSCVDAGTVTALGVGGGLAGAGVGAVIPTGGWHDVYRAR